MLQSGLVNGLSDRIRAVLSEQFAETLALALQILSIKITHTLINWTLGHDASFFEGSLKVDWIFEFVDVALILNWLVRILFHTVLAVRRDYIREADPSNDR